VSYDFNSRILIKTISWLETLLNILSHAVAPRKNCNTPSGFHDIDPRFQILLMPLNCSPIHLPYLHPFCLIELFESFLQIAVTPPANQISVMRFTQCGPFWFLSMSESAGSAVTEFLPFLKGHEMADLKQGSKCVGYPRADATKTDNARKDDSAIQ
jgi:hypothetical protein